MTVMQAFDWRIICEGKIIILITCRLVAVFRVDSYINKRKHKLSCIIIYFGLFSFFGILIIFHTISAILQSLQGLIYKILTKYPLTLNPFLYKLLLYTCHLPICEINSLRLSSTIMDRVNRRSTRLFVYLQCNGKFFN